MHRRAALLLALLAVLFPALVAPSSAASGPTNGLRQVDDLPTVALSPYADWFWHRPDNAFVYPTAAGDIGVATLIKEEGTQLRVRTYDGATFAEKGKAVTVTFPAGWTQWGGITQLDDGSFVVVNGRKNLDEVKGREVIAVRRYTAAWAPGKVAYLTSGTFKDNTDVYVPFAGVKPAMTVVGDRLVVHTGRSRYESSDGDHHQTDLTFEVDLPSMTLTRFDAVGEAPFSSHSFSQQVAMNGDDLVLVDHGDAEPRALQVSVMADYPRQRKVTSYPVLKIGGEWGVNATGLSVTGLVSGPQGVVVLGTSVRQDAKGWDPEKEKRNLFALAFNPRTGASKLTWLTDFAPKGSASAGEPRVVKIADDRFVVLSDVKTGSDHRTEYRLIDSGGTVLAQKTFAGTFFSGVSQPVAVGSRVLWVNKTASDQEYSAWMYALDVSDPQAPTFVSRTRSFPSSPRPTVAGTARVGSTLTASAGDWGTTPAPTFSYQWKVGGSPVTGATNSSFTPTAAHVGKRISVTVRASSPGYATTSQTSVASAPVARGVLTPAVPTVVGSPKVGSVLEAKPGRWSPSGVTFRYQWSVGGKKLAGATKAKLRLTAKQRRKSVTVTVTGSRSGYTSVRRTSSPTAAVR